jgi:hypothetical protein
VAVTADIAHRIPAGWYPDRSNRTRRRWWDGTEWTEYYSAAPIGETAPPPIHSLLRAITFKDRVAASVLAVLLIANGVLICLVAHIF